MHELTLLVGVTKEIGEVVRENNLDHVDAVVLEVGEVTTVVPEFLLDGWSVLSDEYDYLRGSELIIDRIPAIGQCRDCGANFALDENEGCCPTCDSRNRDLVSGTEFLIKEIRILE